MILHSDTARVAIDVDNGARLSSLEVFGEACLVERGESLLHWGCYPLAPWAGRIRNGTFRFEGKQHQLPLTMPPHAIHGTVLDRPWRQESDHSFSRELGENWPWRGEAHQRFTLSDDDLVLELEVRAKDEAFPASIGWHPWFARHLGRGAALELDFAASKIYPRDRYGLPSGHTQVPGLGPYDDCFTELRENPRLRWPGVLELELSSTLDHWVVYDEPQHALCVEPMSGPPDALNLAPRIVTPDAPLLGRFRIAWREDTNSTG